MKNAIAMSIFCIKLVKFIKAKFFCFKSCKIGVLGLFAMIFGSFGTAV